MSSILTAFASSVAAYPDRVAIVDGKGHQVSFAQLQDRAQGFARAWFTRGVRPGDRVLLAMRLDTDLYAALAALWSLGATAVLPEPAMGLKGLRHAARVAKVSAFCSSGLYGVLKYTLPELRGVTHLRPNVLAGAGPDLPMPHDADIALISFTSGTSGAPKAIPRSHGFLTAQHHAVAPMLHSTGAERDLVAFPVFVLINIASGQTSVLPNWKMSRLAKLQPQKLERWITDQNVSRLLLPPALCEKLGTTRIPPSLNTVFTGGGPVFPDVLDRLKAAKSDLRLICIYGSTEAEPIAHLDAKQITAADHASMLQGRGLLVGHPVPDIRLRIQNQEIQVAGAHVNSGYLDPAHDVENKIAAGDTIWHRTGDAGQLDDQGRIWLLGRIGSDVTVGGRQLFPFSIEVAARRWDGVRQCAMMAADAGAYLVVSGDPQHMPAWQKSAADFGISRVVLVDDIPMDRRHASKIDRQALLQKIRN